MMRTAIANKERAIARMGTQLEGLLYPTKADIESANKFSGEGTV